MSTPPLGPVDRPPPLDELVRAEDLERCLAPFVDDIVDGVMLFRADGVPYAGHVASGSPLVCWEQLPPEAIAASHARGSFGFDDHVFDVRPVYASTDRVGIVVVSRSSEHSRGRDLRLADALGDIVSQLLQAGYATWVTSQLHLAVSESSHQALTQRNAELERALRRHHARERRGFAAVMPFAFGRGSPWVATMGVIVASTLTAALIVGRWSCATDDTRAGADASEPTAREGRDRVAPLQGSPESISVRRTDPPLPAAKAFAPRAPDAAGWFAAGSGMSTTGDRTLSTESRYRFDGERLVFETTYIGDDDEPCDAFGYAERDGFDLVAGDDDWAFAILAGETRVVTTILRATREGCVTWKPHSGRRPEPGVAGFGSGSRHDFVLEGGSLRHPKDDRECRPFAHPTEQPLSGTKIDVDVYNDCDQAVEFVVFATPEGKQAPPNLPKERLEAGEHRRLRIDKAQWLRPSQGGAARVDGEGGEVHFFGEGCSSLRVQDR